MDDLKELDEKGFIFVGSDGNAYRCCRWGDSAWLFRWIDKANVWVSVRKLGQIDVWFLPRNLSSEQQEIYHIAEQRNALT